MANDLTDTLGAALGRVVREALGNVGDEPEKPKRRAFSRGKGLIAGVGLAAAAALVAKKGVEALQDGSVDEAIARLRERVDAWALEDGEPEEPGDDPGDGHEGVGRPQGTGKGRRMRAQQAVDVAVPHSRI
jgi:hypothetical protein